MSRDDLVVAITGASGAAYAIRLIDMLLTAGRTVHFTMSPSAIEVFSQELGIAIDTRRFVPPQLFPLRSSCSPYDLQVPPATSTMDDEGCSSTGGRLLFHPVHDFRAGIASGSFLTGGMVICPCSMGTLAGIASGQSQNLIHRAADVHLKERRKLILVPRETPLSPIALGNMQRLAELGVVILPAMPGWYRQPRSLHDLVDFVVARICDQLGVDHQLMHRWGEAPPTV